ncbi:hypothetical protein [Microvirga makkahensis]|uniref:Uncharacterized protein n=1 Tax=Microvirga makkahensis TaxID=1128670 RepID=A0A7X3MVU1_9HYPH|nr:hypothetical protein [Microvirga makkahensis]MXQ14198.1 hypothetical protein [Microvirga makkahensis]
MFGALSKAKRQLDAKVLELQQAEDPKASPLPHWTLHDTRHRFVTHAHDQLGVEIPVIERATNHISGAFGGIVGIYNRALCARSVTPPLTAGIVSAPMPPVWIPAASR